MRWLAEGRDASATIDSADGGFGKNDGDNEITGIHRLRRRPERARASSAPSIPSLFDGGDWRWFYTQQHGDNVTYEVVANDEH